MSLSRRFLLRGTLGGGAVMVGLPMLDIFLDGNGAALAGGGPMPLRFGTWTGSGGMTPARWTPTKAGADYDLPPELEPLAPVKADVSILSGFEVKLDGAPVIPNQTGVWAVRTGVVPANGGEADAPSLDVIIGDRIGGASRLRQLDMHAGGGAASYSRRDLTTINPAMGSPLEAYSRVFGAEFRPDPRLMLRKSVLSGVSERRAALMKKVGEADRQRLDSYFTSIRQLERRLALQLQEASAGAPADLAAVRTNHGLMSEVLVMALACNQTRVFNLAFASASPEAPAAGLATESMAAFAELIGKLSAIREGDRRLIDNTLVYAHSDAAVAGPRELTGIPVMLAGSAGGRIRTNLHVEGRGDPVSRTGLTALRAMGVMLEAWGEKSMKTGDPIGEILV